MVVISAKGENAGQKRIKGIYGQFVATTSIARSVFVYLYFCPLQKDARHFHAATVWLRSGYGSKLVVCAADNTKNYGCEFT